jgi:hypothetical protein
MKLYNRIFNPHNLPILGKIKKDLETALNSGYSIEDLAISSDGNVYLNYSKIEDDAFFAEEARAKAIEKALLKPDEDEVNE